MPVTLHVTRVDAQSTTPGTPLVMAHGLLGQGRNFGTLARGFAADRDVFVVDMRNHGDSPWSEVMDYPAMAEDLAAVIETHAQGRAHVFGHSMGGKAAMRLALDHGKTVVSLIVADIAPVAYTHSHAAEVDALRALDLTTIHKRAEADAALKTNIADPTMRAFLMQNLKIAADGVARRSNLDVLGASMDTLVGWDDPTGRYDAPTLFIAGGNSSYVLPEHESKIATLFPQARIERVPDAGHWIHAEKPQEVLELSTAFLAEATA